MEPDHVEIVRALNDAFLRGDAGAALALMHPDIEFEATARPDANVWRGREAVQRAILEWTGTWDDHSFEIGGYVEAPDGRVLVTWTERGRGKGRGIPIEHHGGNVVTVREGKVLRIALYNAIEDAREAVGLRQSVERVREALGEIARLMAVSTEDPERSLGDDYARVIELLHPEFELVPAASAVERRTLRGPEGFVTFLEGGRDTWRDASLEIEELVDLGDRVLAIATFRARGRASGAEIQQPNATVWTLRDGRVASVQVFFDRAEALRSG